MMKRVSIHMALFTLALLLAETASGQKATALPDPKKDRAQELLERAWAALGGQDKLKEIKSLTVLGKFRQGAGDQGTSGEFKLDLMLPDKYKATIQLSPMKGIDVTSITALSGDQTWADTKTMAPSGVQVFVATPGGAPADETPDLKSTRRDFAIDLLFFTLMPPPSFPFQFSYVGEAEAPDGRAYVLDAQRPDGITVRLFLDQKSYLPLMMTYKELIPQSTVLTVAAREDEIKTMELSKEGEIQARINDYRKVGGVMLPYHVTKTSNGAIYEEWLVGNFKINPSDLDGNSFTKK